MLWVRSVRLVLSMVLRGTMLRLVDTSLVGDGPVTVGRGTG